MRPAAVLVYASACVASYAALHAGHDVVRAFIAAWFTALWISALLRPTHREAAAIAVVFAALSLIERSVNPLPKSYEVNPLVSASTTAFAFVLPIYLNQAAALALGRRLASATPMNDR